LTMSRQCLLIALESIRISILRYERIV